MAQIGLFFGSDEGNTEAVAYRIQQRLGEDVVDVLDISDVTQLEFSEYQQIILGIPTWDFGQIQSDWEEFWPDITDMDFSDKAVAFFGLGDQFGYGDFFLDAMGLLHDVILARTPSVSVVGHWSSEGYDFDASKALIPDQQVFVGLALDEDQQPELTAGRLNEWCKLIHGQLKLDTPLHNIED